MFYLKNCVNTFSYSGYVTALSFKNISDADIIEVERFACEDLKEIILCKCNLKGMEFDESCQNNLFGIYVEPSKFQFSTSDKQLITKISQHINYIWDNEGGLKQFSQIRGDIEWLKGCFFQSIQIQPANPRACHLNEASTFTHKILYKFLKTADENAATSPGGYRFEETKSFASYLRMWAGPAAYETIQKNMPLVFPSLGSTNRFIGKAHHNIIEGEIRCHELKTYLQDRNLQLVVSLSEDATRVTNRVQHDAKTNQLIGFVLPTGYSTANLLTFCTDL